MSDPQTKLGQLIDGTQMRDAIHIAVAPVIAATMLSPGDDIGFVASNQEMVGHVSRPIGIVDPFLKSDLMAGERFWMFLYPNTITSLKHVWTHPAFMGESATSSDIFKSESERWMRAWAIKHMSEDYYGDDGQRSAEVAYADAIEAGRTHSIGPYEDARDHIDGEWWSHWEAITGQRGERDTFFRCAC